MPRVAEPRGFAVGRRIQELVVARDERPRAAFLNAAEFLQGKRLDLIHRSMSDYVIHSTAGIIGEVDSMLSRMHSTGCAGASEARVLDNIDPLAKLAAKR